MLKIPRIWLDGTDDMDRKISSCFLRLEIRLHSYSPWCVLTMFCIFVINSAYSLIQTGHTEMLTVTSGILYVITQSTTYYLLYAPAMVVLLGGLVDTGSYEMMIISRKQSRMCYEREKLLSIFLFAAFSVLSMVVVAASVYLCVDNPNVHWQQHCLFMNQTGMLIVNTNLLNVSGYALIAAQGLLLTISFFSLGVFMEFLQNIFAKKYISVIIPLCISLLVYLLSTCDLPDWLMNILPNSHLFLPHFGSIRHFLTAGIYWLVVLLVLFLGVTLSAKYKDIMYEDYEKQMH